MVGIEKKSNDNELVMLTRKGNKEAFEQLVQRHRGRCIRVALVVLRNAGDAEDEAQNAFWKAFQHIDQFQGDAEFGAWLSRIVVNQCRMLLRQKKRQRTVNLDSRFPDTHRSMELPSRRPDPEKELGVRQLKRVLAEELRRIPPLFRNVIMLRDVREIPMPEVARRLGISTSAAKSRLSRARIELRSRVLRHCKPQPFRLAS
jgi:RNA polymerase sigma-70 factor (ECF subfamily)